MFNKFKRRMAKTGEKVIPLNVTGLMVKTITPTETSSEWVIEHMRLMERRQMLKTARQLHLDSLPQPALNMSLQ